MKPQLNMDKIAKALGAERRGKVTANGGYFGALTLAADVSARLRVPQTGGRPTDPSWTERRQIPMRPETLARLQHFAAIIQESDERSMEPMQVAAVLLELAANSISDEDVATLAGHR
jgi:hypothetical protein